MLNTLYTVPIAALFLWCSWPLRMRFRGRLRFAFFPPKFSGPSYLLLFVYLVRLTKFGTWGLNDGLLLFTGKWKVQFCVASLREFFRVFAGIALNYSHSNAFFLTGINTANLHRPMLHYGAKLFIQSALNFVFAAF